MAARPTARPPAGLASQQVPLFVAFGSDDNGYSGLEGSGAGGGLHFLTELFAGRLNPAGTRNPATFDGVPLHYSFYVNTQYITADADTSAYSVVREDPVWVKRAWREALEAGHEIGVHTHSHPHGREFTVAQWEDEMQRCIEILERPYAEEETPGPRDLSPGLGVARDQLIGFRTPFLEYADATLTAAQNQGFAYDCSLEEGLQEDQNGRNFLWPYRLDHGSPGNPTIGPHPGLWEIPVYVFIVPPDEACERLGVAPGLRTALKRRQDYFDTTAGKITGMDWNLWCEFAMSPAEFLATIMYTVELRLSGNRAPLTIGLHSELYSDRQASSECAATPAERRAALESLVTYLQQHEAVRIVSAWELLAWLRHPVPLGGAT
ncbi:MAG TPA: polysaccharide deacetylase family protein [Thermoanaerobaculaceae bacterium]|nr:polysaccharide deacetylase family protein [Thermoanaerobaculaceae bacterium]